MAAASEGAEPLLDQRGVIRHPDLPFDVQVLAYYKNAQLRELKPADNNLATAGIGLRAAAEPVRASSGATMGSGVDLAAAYVKLSKKDGSGELGTYLFSQALALPNDGETIEVDGKSYRVSLRFRQNHKPYSLTLLDVRKDDYLGTSTPRNYSSDVRLVDADRGIDREVHIWMNNPLRYAGETFYQSGYAGPPDVPVESTTLQIVTNSGWMIPYVACMIVGTGMLAHFWNVLLRFLRRRSETRQTRWQFVPSGRYWTAGSRPGDLPAGVGQDGSAGPKPSALAKRKDRRAAEVPLPAEVLLSESPSRTLTLASSLGVITLFVVLGVWLLASFLPPRVPADGLRIHEFGKLPVIADGRVKPFDTLARNALRVIANRETFKDSSGQSQPAIRWLLDVVANPAAADKHRVFRILNLEVLDTLGLNRRQGSLYSLQEIRRGLEPLEKQLAGARRKDVAELSTYERKLVELDQQLHAYTRLLEAFQPLDLPPLPAPNDDEKQSREKLEAFRVTYANFVRRLESLKPALTVPVQTGLDGKTKPEWQSYAQAWTEASLGVGLLGQKPSPAVASLEAIFAAYGRQEAKAFNDQVDQYQQRLLRDPPVELKTKDTRTNRVVAGVFGAFYRFESYFNHVAPFYHCSVLYLVAFVLSAFAWLGWSRPLNRAAFLLMAATFAVHTLALIARIYISGRPPVTNLYSSAVFIGWGVVGLALIYELLFRSGIGNAVAAVLGFASLLIAHNLAGDGDTFIVLQAVLDTQFWLATHVVCISLGYATTFLAGGLGVAYVLRGLFTPTLRPDANRELTRMIYGTVCFSIFFSFVGTVLGGLWADDSWGRFWGWDPKENGALIIVLWNALVLHANWGRLVKDRGLAVLAVGGNIVTSWSWFGVNELGVGLHSYGFTEGVLRALGLFAISQLIVMGLGMLPKSLWWSFRSQPVERDESPLLLAESK